MANKYKLKNENHSAVAVALFLERLKTDLSNRIFVRISRTLSLCIRATPLLENEIIEYSFEKNRFFLGDTLIRMFSSINKMNRFPGDLPDTSAIYIH